MDKVHISSASPYENTVAYSRAVKIGNIIAVSGTAPINDDGTNTAPGNLYEQTKRCLDIIFKAIVDAGGNPVNIYRTRVYLTDASKWEEAGKAHGEYFRKIMPSCTFVEVKGLLHKDWLVEIEADCWII